MPSLFQHRETGRARALRHAATPAERLLWRYLAKSQLAGCKFSRQMPVGPYFADFLCRSHSVIVELDGYSHDMRQESDAKRDAAVVGMGYQMLRFGNDDVLTNVEGVLMTIREALRQSPTPSPSRRREGGQ